MIKADGGGQAASPYGRPQAGPLLLRVAADDAEVDVVGKSPAEPRKQVAARDVVLHFCDRCVEAVVNEVVQAGDQVNKFWCRRHAYRPM